MQKAVWMLSILPIFLFGYAIKVPGSLTAHFVHSAVGGGHIIQSAGKITVNRSRAFRADISRPSRQKMCNYRSDVQLIDYANHQVIRYDVGSLLDVMQILKVATHYKGNLYKSNYHGYHFILTLNRAGQVSKITFRDKQGMRNTIRFSHIRYNKSPLPASVFRCSAPRSYRVVRGRI